MNQKTIFFDIDGTLMGTQNNHPYTIPPIHLAMLKQLKSDGHHIVAATGRHQIFVQKYFPGIFSSHITLNGAHVVYNGQTIYDRIFTSEEVTYFMKQFDKVHARYTFLGKDCLWARNMDPDTIAYLNLIYGIEDFVKTEWNPEDICANSIDFVFDTEEEYQRCKTIFDGTMILNRHRGNFSADLAFVGQDKAAAIKILQEHAKFELLDTIAFGDGENDITMLRLVGNGIAMGNASQSVCDAAREVTASIFENGIPLSLQKMMLLPADFIQKNS